MNAVQPKEENYTRNYVIDVERNREDKIFDTTVKKKRVEDIRKQRRKKKGRLQHLNVVFVGGLSISIEGATICFSSNPYRYLLFILVLLQAFFMITAVGKAFRSEEYEHKNFRKFLTALLSVVVLFVLFGPNSFAHLLILSLLLHRYVACDGKIEGRSRFVTYGYIVTYSVMAFWKVALPDFSIFNDVSMIVQGIFLLSLSINVCYQMMMIALLGASHFKDLDSLDHKYNELTRKRDEFRGNVSQEFRTALTQISKFSVMMNPYEILQEQSGDVQHERVVYDLGVSHILTSVSLMEGTKASENHEILKRIRKTSRRSDELKFLSPFNIFRDLMNSLAITKRDRERILDKYSFPEYEMAFLGKKESTEYHLQSVLYHILQSVVYHSFQHHPISVKYDPIEKEFSVFVSSPTYDLIQRIKDRLDRFTKRAINELHAAFEVSEARKAFMVIFPTIEYRLINKSRQVIELEQQQKREQHIFALSQANSSSDLIAPEYKKYYSHVRVLVVEDNKFIQKTILYYLKHQLSVTNVTVVGDGMHCLQTLDDAANKGESFDLIYMDVSLPQMDGLQVIRLLQEWNFEFGSLHLLTAEVSLNLDEVRESCCSEIQSIILKPFAPHDFLPSITSVVVEKKSFEENGGLHKDIEERKSRIFIFDDDDEYEEEEYFSIGLDDEEDDDGEIEEEEEEEPKEEEKTEENGKNEKVKNEETKEDSECTEAIFDCRSLLPEDNEGGLNKISDLDRKSMLSPDGTTKRPMTEEEIEIRRVEERQFVLNMLDIETKEEDEKKKKKNAAKKEEKWKKMLRCGTDSDTASKDEKSDGEKKRSVMSLLEKVGETDDNINEPDINKRFSKRDNILMDCRNAFVRKPRPAYRPTEKEKQKISINKAIKKFQEKMKRERIEKLNMDPERKKIVIARTLTRFFFLNCRDFYHICQKVLLLFYFYRFMFWFAGFLTLLFVVDMIVVLVIYHLFLEDYIVGDREDFEYAATIPRSIMMLLVVSVSQYANGQEYLIRLAFIYIPITSAIVGFKRRSLYLMTLVLPIASIFFCLFHYFPSRSFVDHEKVSSEVRMFNFCCEMVFLFALMSFPKKYYKTQITERIQCELINRKMENRDENVEKVISQISDDIQTRLRFLVDNISRLTVPEQLTEEFEETKRAIEQLNNSTRRLSYYVKLCRAVYLEDRKTSFREILGFHYKEDAKEHKKGEWCFKNEKKEEKEEKEEEKEEEEHEGEDDDDDQESKESKEETVQMEYVNIGFEILDLIRKYQESWCRDVHVDFNLDSIPKRVLMFKQEFLALIGGIIRESFKCSCHRINFTAGCFRSKVHNMNLELKSHVGKNDNNHDEEEEDSEETPKTDERFDAICGVSQMEENKNQNLNFILQINFINEEKERKKIPEKKEKESSSMKGEQFEKEDAEFDMDFPWRNPRGLSGAISLYMAMLFDAELEMKEKSTTLSFFLKFEDDDDDDDS